MSDDQRLIEDLIPVEEISRASASEKVGGRKGHPSTLHLWWARRPLAAARGAVYATLVRSADTPDEARSAEYFSELCRWGGSEDRIADARERVLAANDGQPPRVLDLFAGGGAIPLEAARLGCEATAVELNPVAHLIELCMLDYPQRFGPSLAEDVREAGARWVEQAWNRAGHLYPPVEPPPGQEQLGLEGGGRVAEDRRPIAYLWTRTVPCPNPELGEHVIPLVRQTWLARKKRRYIALKPVVDRDALEVGWEVVEAATNDGLDFDPAGFSSRGRATCFVCGAAVDADYVKQEGRGGAWQHPHWLLSFRIRLGADGSTWLPVRIPNQRTKIAWRWWRAWPSIRPTRRLSTPIGRRSSFRNTASPGFATSLPLASSRRSVR